MPISNNLSQLTTDVIATHNPNCSVERYPNIKGTYNKEINIPLPLSKYESMTCFRAGLFKELFK
jgi:hypothetical protein